MKNTKIIKLLENNVKENLGDPELSNGFLDKTAKAVSMKGRTDEQDLIKMENRKIHCEEKEKATTNGDRMFAKHTSDKGPASKIHRELLKDPNKSQAKYPDISAKKIHR